MDYAEIMKMALSNGQTYTHPNPATLRRHMPSTTHRSAARTGDTIYGYFETFRDRNGQLRFIGQDGQYIVR